jgi:hypothetical protein
VSLSLAVRQSFSPEAFTPLLQLSALTTLEVSNLGAAAEGAVRVAAQLIELKQLTLRGLRYGKDPALHALTALTALQELTLNTAREASWNTTWTLSNEVSLQSLWHLCVLMQKLPSDAASRCVALAAKYD